MATKKTATQEKVYKSRVLENYDKEVKPALVKKFGYKNTIDRKSVV